VLAAAAQCDNGCRNGLRGRSGRAASRCSSGWMLQWWGGGVHRSTRSPAALSKVGARAEQLTDITILGVGR